MESVEEFPMSIYDDALTKRQTRRHMINGNKQASYQCRYRHDVSRVRSYLIGVLSYLTIFVLDDTCKPVHELWQTVKTHGALLSRFALFAKI